MAEQGGYMLTIRYNEQLRNDQDFQNLLASTKEYSTRLRDVAKSGVYQESESSLLLASDQGQLDQVLALASQKTNGQLRYHIVVGIGGSNLGTKAVYDALHGAWDALEPGHTPKLLFAETTDPEWLVKASALLQTLESPEQVFVSVISKSGGTTETLANFEIIMHALTAKLGDVRSRVVAITDEGSALWEQAGGQSIARLAIPKPVGGRFSVLSSVGLFPLATVGVDITALLGGASAMRDACLAEESEPTAAISAALLAHNHAKGKTINDNFFFHPELESLGKWYRQLMGESIGKAESLGGDTVHTGITPTVSLGSTDLHSVGQLYLGGPRDKFTTFVYTEETADIQVPATRVFPELIPAITEKSAQSILEAILDGVKIAYQKADLPFMEVVMERIDERTIGAYLQFKMLEMMYLGRLLNVNPFDQPSVESYKIETKKILEG
jgi:glucose-6-phosphate isomerase